MVRAAVEERGGTPKSWATMVREYWEMVMALSSDAILSWPD